MMGIFFNWTRVNGQGTYEKQTEEEKNKMEFCVLMNAFHWKTNTFDQFTDKIHTILEFRSKISLLKIILQQTFLINF